jgi:hypothetical protein
VVTAYLGLDQHQVDEDYDEIMFDVVVCEALAVRALGEADAGAEGARVGF